MIVKRRERQPWNSDEQKTLTEGMCSTPCWPLNELQGTVCIMQPNFASFLATFIVAAWCCLTTFAHAAGGFHPDVTYAHRVTRCVGTRYVLEIASSCSRPIQELRSV